MQCVNVGQHSLRRKKTHPIWISVDHKGRWHCVSNIWENSPSKLIAEHPPLNPIFVGFHYMGPPPEKIPSNHPPKKKNIFNHKNCSNNQSFSNIRPVQSKEIGRKLFLALNLRSFRAGGAEPSRSQNSKVVGILVFWYHRRVGRRGLYLWCSLFFFPTQCLENS